MHFAVCRDQIATDGFTIWGAPIAGYYPSVNNCWSPAQSPTQQIDAPVFRMLGQDPVYYYDSQFPLPDGTVVRQPDTMEPVWTSGRTKSFIDAFLRMIATSPTSHFAYAQLGQENNFGWPDMAEAYPKQMDELVRIRDAGTANIETMGETGRRFKKRFKVTPSQSQIMLSDPYANTKSPETTVWYQSRFYRANLHFRGELIYFRDITVYSDTSVQPFLNEPTRDHEVHQRLPAVLDGHHWKKDNVSLNEPGSGGFFMVDGHRVKTTGPAKVEEAASSMAVEVPIDGRRMLRFRFDEQTISISLAGGNGTESFAVSFEWEPSKAALKRVEGKRVSFARDGLDYAIQIAKGQAEPTPTGWVSRATANQIAWKLPAV